MIEKGKKYCLRQDIGKTAKTREKIKVRIVDDYMEVMRPVTGWVGPKPHPKAYTMTSRLPDGRMYDGWTDCLDVVEVQQERRKPNT